MGKQVTSIILLMLSLEALLLVAGLSAATAGGSGADQTRGVIRLPSDTASGESVRARRMPGDDEERPWECCDAQPCTKSIPAMCSCHDLLERCSKACKECGKVWGSDPPRYICKDVYIGDPAPRCHEDHA